MIHLHPTSGGGCYTAPDMSEGAKAIAAEIPQPEGRGIEAESAVPVTRHSPKT